MKKKIKIGKVIGIIFFSLIVIVLSYLITYYVDKYNMGKKEANVTVTFDDTETYTIPNTSVLIKEDALKEWPYMFTINNEGNTDSLYQFIIKDKQNTLERTNLAYALYLDEKEIKTGLLSDINDDILYQSTIGKNVSQRYKLYIWVNKEVTAENKVYEYQITLNAIMDGGPGF